MVLFKLQMTLSNQLRTCGLHSVLSANYFYPHWSVNAARRADW